MSQLCSPDLVFQGIDAFKEEVSDPTIRDDSRAEQPKLSVLTVVKRDIFKINVDNHDNTHVEDDQGEVNPEEGNRTDLYRKLM